METFKGKVHQVTESVLTPRRLPNDPRKERIMLRMTLLFDPEGHLMEELNRDRKHANRIAYKYNKRGNCVEQTEFNTDHRPARRFLFKYDQWGNQIEEQGYDAKGSLQQTLSRRYNEQGEEIEKRLRRGDSNEKISYRLDAQGHVEEEYKTMNGKFALRRLFRYDSYGQKTEVLLTDSTGLVKRQRYEYRYDAQARILEERVLRNDGELMACYTFAYDAAGHITDRKQSDAEGHFRGSHYTFDEAGHNKTTWWYNSESHSCGRLVYAYDGSLLVAETMTHGTLTAINQEIETEGEQVVQQVRYASNNEHTDYRHTHAYYGDGQLKESYEEHYDENGVVVQRILRQYDTLGNLLMEQQNETTVQYQYDANSNWVKRTQLFDGVVMETIVRNITYYA